MRYLLAILAFIASAGAAQAQACSVSATTMGFPAYNAFSGSPADATSTVTVTCTGLLFIGVTYNVQLDGGQEGNILARKMQQGPGNKLAYQVYLDSGRTTPWGNGVQGSTFGGTMLLGLFSRTNTRTVYGRIPASQHVQSGDYSDGPVMTVIY